MSGQSYIGSKISLISLSDIRYVGILFRINPNDSTLALKNVMTYGTEGRKGGGLYNEIPASESVFDYIVFRGSDIKDLQVFQTPSSYEPTKPEPIISSPPIITAPLNNNYYSQYPSYGDPSSYSSNDYWQNNNMLPYLSSSNGHPQTFQPPFQQTPQMHMPVPEFYQSPRQSFATNSSFIVSPTNSKEEHLPPTYTDLKHGNNDTTVAATTTTSSLSNGKTLGLSSEKEAHYAPNTEKTSAVTDTAQASEKVEESENCKETIQTNDEDVDSLVKQVSDLTIKQVSANLQEKKPLRKEISKTKKATQYGGGDGSGNNSGSRGKDFGRERGRGRGRNRGESRGGADPAKQPNNLDDNRGGRRREPRSNNDRSSIIPGPDFDFISANAKFDKTEFIEKNENEKNELITVLESDQFYNKKKSFFDDISCESNEYKSRARGKHQEERKLNIETFGQADINSQSGTKRNHYRGNKGRGHGGKSEKISTNKELKVAVV